MDSEKLTDPSWTIQIWLKLELKSKMMDRPLWGLELGIERSYSVLKVHMLYRLKASTNSKIDPVVGIGFRENSILYPEEPYALCLWTNPLHQKLRKTRDLRAQWHHLFRQDFLETLPSRGTLFLELYFRGGLSHIYHDFFVCLNLC